MSAPARPAPPRRVPRTALAAVVVAVLAIAAAVAYAVTRRDAATVTSADRVAAVPVGGGVRLGALVFEPDGAGRHPMVVMPASWGQDRSEYERLAPRFTAAGFVVVAYTQRGFRGAGGRVDFAGTPTQRDASRVIDWALAHTSADPARIGMLGVSYGAGTSLLAAARDARIKAVAALSTWTDLAASFRPDGTTATASLGTLLASARSSGTLAGPFVAVQQQLATDPAGAGAAFVRAAGGRSPSDVVAGLNAHRTAVLVGNAWEDSIFAPAQLVPFVQALRGPSRLQLAPGDHGGPELSGLDGATNTTTSDALRWLQQYVAGTDTGIAQEPRYSLQDEATGARHTSASWPGTTGRTTVDLAAPATGALGVSGGPVAWTARITAGLDSVATAGPTSFVPNTGYRPPTAAVAAVSPDRGLVWAGTALASATLVCGTPSVHVRVASSATTATVITHLYDVDEQGSGTLMTVTPASWTGLTPGTARSVTLALQPTCRTVAKGHRLAVVVDTVDPRWHSLPPVGTTLTFSSTTADPATVTVPVG